MALYRRARRRTSGRHRRASRLARERTDVAFDARLAGGTRGRRCGHVERACAFDGSAAPTDAEQPSGQAVGAAAVADPASAYQDDGSHPHRHRAADDGWVARKTKRCGASAERGSIRSGCGQLGRACGVHPARAAASVRLFEAGVAAAADSNASASRLSAGSRTTPPDGDGARAEEAASAAQPAERAPTAPHGAADAIRSELNVARSGGAPTRFVGSGAGGQDHLIRTSCSRASAVQAAPAATATHAERASPRVHCSAIDGHAARPTPAAESHARAWIGQDGRPADQNRRTQQRA